MSLYTSLNVYLSKLPDLIGKSDNPCTSDNRSTTEKEAEHINMLHFLPLRNTTICEIQTHTETDPILIVKHYLPSSRLTEIIDNVLPQLQWYYTKIYHHLQGRVCCHTSRTSNQRDQRVTCEPSSMSRLLEERM